MDIVYPVKKASLSNIELRYSLRSLKNIKHDKVYIIWYIPDWIKNIIHIPFEDKLWRLENVRAKYRIICEDERISEDFIFMMDDIFILRPIKEIKYYKIARIKDYLEYLKQRGIEWWSYYQAIQWLYNIYGDKDCFDTHTPIVYNKTKLREIINKYGWIKWSKRSIYCLEYGIEWVFGNFPNYNNIETEYKVVDCKCYDIDKLTIYKKQEYLSTNNKTVKQISPRLEKIFNKPSKYENFKSKCLNMDKLTVIFNRNLSPYKKWDIWELRTDKALYWENKWAVKIIKKKENKSMWFRDKEIKEIKDYSLYTKADICKELENKGIQYKKSMKKADLLELLK